jgi:hypothetical protein
MPADSGQRTPAARSFWTTSRLCGSAKNWRIDCATIGPTSRTASRSASVAAISASSEPKCFARSLAVVSPTLRMPSAKMKRASVVALLDSMAATRLAADFSAIRSSPASVSRLRP